MCYSGTFPRGDGGSRFRPYCRLRFARVALSRDGSARTDCHSTRVRHPSPPVCGTSKRHGRRTNRPKIVRTSYFRASVLSILQWPGGCLLWFKRTPKRWLVPIARVVLIGACYGSLYGRSAQCDPSLYYPRIPVLEQWPGKPRDESSVTIASRHCRKHMAYATSRDMTARPSRLMDLDGDRRMIRAFHPVLRSLTKWFRARCHSFPAGCHPPFASVGHARCPIYVIFRGRPLRQFTRPSKNSDYWVLVNRTALPTRVRSTRVETVADNHDRRTNWRARIRSARGRLC